MKVLCKHCQNTCKQIGLVECDKYNAKANRPEQLKLLINKAYKDRNFELAHKLSEELFIFQNGGANKNGLR